MLSDEIIHSVVMVSGDGVAGVDVKPDLFAGRDVFLATGDESFASRDRTVSTRCQTGFECRTAGREYRRPIWKRDYHCLRQMWWLCRLQPCSRDSTSCRRLRTHRTHRGEGPVRSGLAGWKTLEFSKPPRPRDVPWAGTARAVVVLRCVLLAPAPYSDSLSRQRRERATFMSPAGHRQLSPFTRGKQSRNRLPAKSSSCRAGECRTSRPRL
jgi:hypothetical protein